MDKQQARDILGVSEDAPKQDIEERYRELIKKNHPDQGGSSALFKQIKEAQKVLIVSDSSDGPTNAEPNKNKSGTYTKDNKHSRNCNSSGTKSTGATETYNSDKIGSDEIDKIVQKAKGESVTHDRMIGEPAVIFSSAVTNSPPIDYISKSEDPHYILRMTIEETNTRQGYLIVSNKRISMITNGEKEDHTARIYYNDINDASLLEISGILDYFYNLFGMMRISINTNLGEYILLLAGNSISEGYASNKSEFAQEKYEALDYIRGYPDRSRP